MPASNAVRVEGLRELQRAFKRADRTLALELRHALRDAAEPVRATAEQLAVSAIPKVTLPWSRMRVGVTQSLVYVAPRQRGAKSPARRRPNFAVLLLGRAMEPALAENREEVVQRIDEMLAVVGHEWEA